MPNYKRQILLLVKRMLIIVGFGGLLWSVVIMLLVWPMTIGLWLYAIGFISGFTIFFFLGVAVRVPLRVIVVHGLGDIQVIKKPPGLPYLDPTDSIRTIMKIANLS